MPISTSFRHYKALSRKNAINWKRTPLGSVTEIVCPVLLMLVLVYARYITVPEEMDSLKISALRHPIFPPSKPNEDGKFDISWTNAIENTIDYNSFMRYTQYTNLKQNITLPENITRAVTNETQQIVIDTYFPPIDPLGPYLFYPRQCYATKGEVEIGRKHASMMIAYVKQGNSIEQDVIDQLEAIFSLQRQIGKGFQAISSLSTLNSMFPGLINIPGLSSALISSSGALGEFELDENALDSLGFNATDDDIALGTQ